MVNNRIGNKVFNLIWVLLIFLFDQFVFQLSYVAEQLLYFEIGALVFFTLLSMIFNRAEVKYIWMDVMNMIFPQLVLLLFFLTEVIIRSEIVIFPIIVYMVFSLILLIGIINTMYIVKNSIAIWLTFPILILTLGAQFIVAAVDIIFPPRLQELVPYIEVTREMIFSLTQFMASEERIQAKEALENLETVSGRVEEIAEGYALRKGLGQGIDLGLTFIVFVLGGVLTFMTSDLRIPPQVIAALFASLGLALSTFAGFFGPFYGLASSCKEFTLKHGNYRGAVIYKAIEQLFSIPFMAASAGFLLLDLPPIDGESLDEFKNEMNDQINEIGDNINSLLGTDSSAVPRKTRKMIANLVGSEDSGLGKLDFRNILKETNRAFALTYYQHEFSWKPWKRKSIVSEFAERIHFDLQGAEDALKLIGFKIQAGQLDDDMVNNIMVSAAMKGVIMMEQKYMEMLGDLELGQTCTGLAFGARQFIEDHYVVRTEFIEKFIAKARSFFIGFFAVPIVLIISFHNYANRFFDEVSYAFADMIFDGRGAKLFKMRAHEVYGELLKIPANIRASRAEKKELKKDEEKVEEMKEERNFQIKAILITIVSKVWQVIVFPIKIIIGIILWPVKKFRGEEENKREQFEEAVSHAALVSMYEELYKQLIMQTNISF
ncbi:MAG: hypothetical protein INQ03_13180 [Candidatus Heimdallarchaeota archaeon]|nr:hypothetical protein [Candidatus Heimdallarchaeota archaeon]